MIAEGIQRADQVPFALPFGCTVPSARISRWIGNMLGIPSEFSTQRRYVNRFKLGADPEFIFVDSTANTRVDACALNLAQGLAFGMDNNGRLTELRPAPSRSAVEVVASLLAELRWMAIYKPETLKYAWQAGAFLHGDGLGGHVHFGRKRPNQSVEVRALDTIEEELLHLKAYSALEVARRRQGDEHHNPPYGMPGDVRQQSHGYEYRTFPSWLDSPELAFLTLVLSKLAVHNPGLVQGYKPLQYERYFQRMRNFLSYYKDTDDDARIALMIVAHKMPQHQGGDFKARWGIPSEIKETLPKIVFIPDSIKPSEEDIAEVFMSFWRRTPLEWRIPTPTWSPLVPPESYYMVIARSNTRLAKGLGELLWDVVTHKSNDPVFTANNSPLKHNAYFSVPAPMAKFFPVGWSRLCNNKIVTHEGDARFIYVSPEARNHARYNDARRVLLETILPYWKIKEVREDSFAQWQTAHKTSRSASGYAGEIIHGTLAALPLRIFQ